MPNEALILAGGLGTRLGSLTQETPKPILDVGGRPFMEYVIWNLKRYGITRILLSTGYLADKVEAALGDGSAFGVQLEYIAETEPLGTGGATRFARERLADRFFVLNGDSILDANFWALTAEIGSGPDAAMALRHVPDVSRFGACTLERNRVVGFHEKGQVGEGWINGGVYSLSQELVDLLPEGASSLERDLFPRLAQDRRMMAVPSPGFFLDIGLPETYEEAQSVVPEWQKKPCVFLDRDGVINKNTHHTYRPLDFEWVPGAHEAIRWLNENGYLVLIVTNQGGIAKGKYTEAQFHAFMAWMSERLREKGAHWDGYYYSPYHATEGIGNYRIDSDLRKPKPGMILKGLEEWPIRREGSFLLGDAETDVQAAENAGIPGFLYRESEGTVFEAVQSAIATLR